MTQAFNLSQFANKVNTSGQADLTTAVTGTLPVANGGTNQTTYTNGQLLIGNTTGNTLTKATLTAGTNISITNGAGSITIAATGGGVTSLNGETGAITNTDYGVIGSYVIAATNVFTVSLVKDANVTVAGNTLIRTNATVGASAFAFNGTNNPSIASSQQTSLSLSGTWRRMTRSANNNSASNAGLDLYVRIS
jgi:hypothetical protein